MGWTSNYGWTRKVEVVRDIKSQYRDKAKEFKEVKDGLWVLTKDNDIHLVLIEKRDRRWWEKGLTADCGPFVYDVPARWLKDWSPKTEHGQKWLEGVRNYQAECKKDLIGAKVVYRGIAWTVDPHPVMGGKYRLKNPLVEMDVTKYALRRQGKIIK